MCRRYDDNDESEVMQIDKQNWKQTGTLHDDMPIIEMRAPAAVCKNNQTGEERVFMGGVCGVDDNYASPIIDGSSLRVPQNLPDRPAHTGPAGA